MSGAADPAYNGAVVDACAHEPVTRPEGGVVCGQCGLVLEEEQSIVSVVEFTNTGAISGTRVPFTRAPKRKRRIDKNLHEVMVALGLNSNNETARLLLEAIKKEGIHVRDSKVLAASIGCHIARSQFHKTLVLTDVAKKLSVNLFELGRALKKIQAIKVNIGSEELNWSEGDYNKILKCAAAEMSLGYNQNEVEKRAVSVMSQVMESATGRHPSGFVGGALAVSLEMTGLPKSELEAHINYLADRFNVAARTITKRAGEIKTIIKKKGQEVMDMRGTQIKRARLNAPENLLELLSMLEEQQEVEEIRSNARQDASPQPVRSTTTCPHPSFVQNQKKRARRTLKLQRAKARLITTLTGQYVATPQTAQTNKKRRRSCLDNDEAYDDEDRTIELLLLQGVSEEDIISGYYDVDPNARSYVEREEDTELGEADLPESELHNFVRMEGEEMYDHTDDIDTDVTTKGTYVNPYRRKCCSA